MAKIQYKSIKVRAVHNSSGIFYGDNIQYKWRSKAKKSDGFGNIKGSRSKISNNITAASKKES
ncbi:hypothetical protein [Bacillus sp. 7894-2]|uniref:hypothetical protein n=1 Tax=Bacillus sp. 7894-2 TaxID=2021695 RepID=UPI000BA765C0|nr:hypothetical protein [Bacillus sp. 7894-2]PAE22774.1 hypothetical protein CHI10_21340 [Bacillus sp. 7894-2]